MSLDLGVFYGVREFKLSAGLIGHPYVDAVNEQDPEAFEPPSDPRSTVKP